MSGGIHGQVNWAGGLRPSPIDFARYVNGEERRADSIELDGVEYVPDPIEEVRTSMVGGSLLVVGVKAFGKWFGSLRRRDFDDEED